jgi:hypothetical protein
MNTDDTQLDDLRAMRDACRQHAYQVVLAEQIGTATLRILHPKRHWWQRVRG